MLRRRKKDQRDAKRPPRVRGPQAPAPMAPSATPVSRRRARRDAAVPTELRIRNAPPASPPEPREPKARKAVRPGQVMLVTGFEPFGGERSNPSWEVAVMLPHTIAGLRVERCRVPCEFGRAIEVVADAIERLEPELVLCLGQAGGRSRLGVERVAINVDDARAPDNAGAQPIDAPIAVDGPPAYFATLPVKAMVAAMRQVGAPAELSNTAGTYVCNHLMYGVLHFIAASGRAARAGFVHVPYSESQAIDKPGVASMALGTMARGIEAALVTACARHTDIATPEGTLD
jgi:pyroglutamyl-peptidase